MGVDTLLTRSNGQTIDETWFNLLKTTLEGDLVPRNGSGSATDAAGSLGRNLIRFLDLYLKSSGKIYLGDAELYIGSSKLSFKDTGSGSAYAISDKLVNVENLVTLSGESANSINHGTFTGTTIQDNRTTKQALQDIETAYETSVIKGYGNVSNDTVDHGDVNGEYTIADHTINCSGTIQGFIHAEIETATFIAGTPTAQGRIYLNGSQIGSAVHSAASAYYKTEINSVYNLNAGNNTISFRVYDITGGTQSTRSQNRRIHVSWA